MFCVYVISVALILYGRTIQGATTTKDAKPVAEFIGTDESLNQMVREMDALKIENANLKLRLEHQTSNEPILTKFDDLVNAVNDLGNLLQNDCSAGDMHRYSNCAEALMENKQSGIYMVKVGMYGPPLPVYCDANTFGGNWTVIQRRQDGSVDFYLNWTDYKSGFGNVIGEFFIGLDNLHALTAESPQELLIELESFENEIRYAKYDAFAIGNEDEDYALKVLGNYSGNAGDAFAHHIDMKFSTKDRDNDNWSSGSCAHRSQGGWWFKSCQRCHLNGVYSKSSKVAYEQGINWFQFTGDYDSMKSARMLIRPKNFRN